MNHEMYSKRWIQPGMMWYHQQSLILQLFLPSAFDVWGWILGRRSRLPNSSQICSSRYHQRVFRTTRVSPAARPVALPVWNVRPGTLVSSFTRHQKSKPNESKLYSEYWYIHQQSYYSKHAIIKRLNE